MRQTVTGRFRTWDDARHAQDVLLHQGFAAGDIELPAHAPGVLAGIERLMASFFATEHRVGGAPHTLDDKVLLAVHVMDDAHAELACATLGAEHAVEVAIRTDPWSWATPDESPARERSALDELGLADLATAVWRRTMTQPSPEHDAPRQPAPRAQAPSWATPSKCRARPSRRSRRRTSPRRFPTSFSNTRTTRRRTTGRCIERPRRRGGERNWRQRPS
ncbi:hypothetical protein WJ542_23725 [Paraburkholderia sp. B3]|uniref:hypothetical protein n=1 Tax=Paraburkholderia sp. B3 TaxID=3134791 RepID=UPI0039824BF5